MCFLHILGNVKVYGEGSCSTSEGNITYGTGHGGGWILELWISVILELVLRASYFLTELLEEKFQVLKV